VAGCWLAGEGHEAGGLVVATLLVVVLYGL
jgi:hypothetical protein